MRNTVTSKVRESIILKKEKIRKPIKKMNHKKSQKIFKICIYHLPVDKPGLILNDSPKPASVFFC